jgi:hypothetical protein
MPKSVDKVVSMVLSAVFHVETEYPYADELLIKLNEYPTSSGGSTSVFSIS